MSSNLLIPFLRALHHKERTLSLRAFDAARIQNCIARGLGPLLCLASRESGGHDDVRMVLRSADLTARVLIGQLTDAMVEILDVVRDLDVPIVLLKGISICEEYYPETHCRTMGDIDFLVPEEAYAAIEARIMELGYRRRSHRVSGDFSDHHHGEPLFHDGRGVWVEIHTGLFPPSAPVSRDAVFEVSSVMGEARPSTFFRRPVQRLSAELQLIYIASHWAYDLSRHFGREGVVMPLVDVIYLLDAAGENIDWERVLGWSSDTMAGSYLYLMLAYLSGHGLASIPAGVLQRLGRHQRVIQAPTLVLLRRSLDRYVLGDQPYGWIMSKRSVAIVWKTLLGPGSPWRNLARVPWNLLFPPGDEGRFRLRQHWKRVKARLLPAKIE